MALGIPYYSQGLDRPVQESVIDSSSADSLNSEGMDSITRVSLEFHFLIFGNNLWRTSSVALGGAVRLLEH